MNGDDSNAPRLSTRQKRWLGLVIILGPGFGLSAITAYYALLPDAPFIGRTVSAIALVFLGVPLLYAGYWIDKQAYSGEQIWHLAAWTLIGAVPTSIVIALVFGYQRIHGVEIANAGLLLIWVSTIGALGGLLTGVHDLQRLREQIFTDCALNSLSDIFYAFDEDGKYLRINERFATVTGYDADDIADVDLLSLFEETDRGRVESAFEAVLENRERVTVNATLNSRTGDRVPYEFTGAPLYNEIGEFVGISGIGRDITEKQHRTQRIQVLNRVLRHNLRTALNVINGNVEMLDDDLPDDAIRHLTAIETAVTELNAMIEKVDTVRKALDEKPKRGTDMNLTALTETCANEIATDYPNARISVDGEPETIVEADTSLKSAIEEAILNAVVHNDTDEPAVDVTVNQNHVTHEVVIEDDCPPIPRGELDAIENGRETQLEHGSGIGLWLMSWVVSNHGGDLSIERTDRRGNRVTIEVPAEPSMPEAIPAESND